jgi:hypothetical protein
MALTTLPPNKWLDLPRWRGQRVDHFTFEWINGITGETLGWLQPKRDSSPPTLSHNTTQSTKRQLAISLGVRDTAAINPITDRIAPWVTIGTDPPWPLGRYMFTDDTDLVTSAGDHGAFTLLDEGFAIDQQLSVAYSSTSAVDIAVRGLVSQVSFIRMKMEPSNFTATGAFPAGQTRGQALDAYTSQGDYFPYWMDNEGYFRMIRTKDPALEIPDFDLDDNPRVRRDAVTRTSDLLQAPNRFIRISNSSDAGEVALVGTYDVPPSAPHSIANRGFVVPDVQNVQITSQEQADAMARNAGIRQTIFERMSFSTAFDPRHDSYNVIRFQGVNWLELSWSATLVPGAAMTHTVRKAYS